MRSFVTLLAFSFLSLGLRAQNLILTNYATSLNKPIGIENCGDDRLFIIEQPGIIRILDKDGKKVTTPFLDIRSKIRDNGNEQGLLGLAFHPKYLQNGYFFVNYTNTSGNTVVARYTVTNDKNVADASSEKIVLTVNQPYSNHNGGCLLFGKDGCLYIGLGDGGAGGDPKNSGQDPQSLLGKMLRIDVDTDKPYEVPKDNPFVSDNQILDEIWAFGVRNPWKFAFDALNGDLWIGDVGQDEWEEIDFQPGTSKGGENYGWRCYEGTHTYNTAGCQDASSYTKPVFEFENNNQSGCSVTGGLVYRGSKYKSLYGRYLFTDYCSGNIWVISKVGNTFDTKLLGQFTQYNYTAFGQDQYGELYLAERETGKIVKISVDECKPAAFIWSNENTIVMQHNDYLRAGYHPENSYQWLRNDQPISNATSHELQITTTGKYQVIVTNAVDCVDTSDAVSVTQIITQVGRPSDLDVTANYTHGTLRIQLSKDQDVQTVSVFDMSGKQVFTKQGTPGRQLEFSIPELKKGQSYLLQVQTEAGRVSEVFPVY